MHPNTLRYGASQAKIEHIVTPFQYKSYHVKSFLGNYHRTKVWCIDNQAQIPGMSEIEVAIWSHFDHDFCKAIGTGLWAIQPFLTLKHFDLDFCMAIGTDLWAIKPFLTIKLCRGQFI
jgi:hypothetical protein